MASGELHSPLWLGLDLSTQSLTLVLLPDEPGRPHVYLDSIVYARDLPQYQTEHGMHISNGDDGEKVGYTLEGQLVFILAAGRYLRLESRVAAA